VTGGEGPVAESVEARLEAAVFDEMVTGGGRLRPVWRDFLGSFGPLDAEALGPLSQEAERLLRQNGVTYASASGSGADGTEAARRPWVLDLIPLLLSGEEWAEIEAGVIQRARLLDAVAADLYGRQAALHAGLVPPSLLFQDPAYLRPCHGIRPPGDVFLHICAFDLARRPDGRWVVLAERTNTPSGAGYALENRTIISHLIPDSFRYCGARSLTPFFDRLASSLCPTLPDGAVPTVVLLTPGPYSEAWFEHAFLARHLGLTLVQGEDLTVRDQRVYLKTLSGLKRVHGILRWLDDSFCDPLELRPESALGVTGLVQAVRAGTVTVANGLGSGVLESTGLQAFLPKLARFLLGSPLSLAQVATHWCGRESGLAMALENLDHVVVKPAYRSVRRGGAPMQPVFGRSLDRAERAGLLADLRDRPDDFAVQETIRLSTVPVWTGRRLEPRPVVLRVIAARTGDGYVVMPGGLTRFSTASDDPVVSMRTGGGSKDCWVLRRRDERGGRAFGPAEPIDAQGNRASPSSEQRIPALNASTSAAFTTVTDLPSRVADGLFWVGRYAERGEASLRVLSAAFRRLLPDHDHVALVQEPVFVLMARLHMVPIDIADAAALPNRAVRTALLTAVFDADHPNSLRADIRRLQRAAHAVRDRFGPDIWRVLAQIDRLSERPPDQRSSAALLLRLDDLRTAFAALAGLKQESLPRGLAWRFVDMGQRLERAINTVDWLRHLPLPALDGAAGLRSQRTQTRRRTATPPPRTDPVAVTETLLTLADSLHARAAAPNRPDAPPPATHALLTDADNPRSVRFQLDRLANHLKYLPRPAEARTEDRRHDDDDDDDLVILLRTVVALLEPAVGPPDHAAPALVAIADHLPALSERLTEAYFSHVRTRPI